MQSNPFQFDHNIPWEDLGGGVSRKIFGYNNDIMLVKVKFEKGAVGALHHHYHTQVTYVESGSFEMTIGNEKKLIKKGDGFCVSPDIEHGIVCLEPGMLIDVFNPHREDFLKK